MPVYETAPVVLEIGSAYTKIGFAADSHPRFIIPSKLRDISTGTITNLFDYKSKDDLYSQMLDFMQNVFFKHALVSPRERKIVIVESVLCPTEIRENLANILFCKLEVLSVLFVPAHLVSLASLATDTALVVDIGHKEAQVIPVFCGMQVMNAWEAYPIAADAVHNEIKQQLVDIGVKSTLLTDEVIEDIKVRTCFVNSFERANQYLNADSSIVPCLDVEYPIKGQQVITVPGKLRETAFEVLFPHDSERAGLPYAILDSILKCPLDMRRKLADNLLFVGGTSMTLGLLSRIKAELFALLKTPLYKDKLFLDSIKFHMAPGKPNFTTWLGGSLYGGTDLLQTRSLSREMYAKNAFVPDWTNYEDNRTFGSK